MNYFSGKLNPLLALVPPQIRKIDFCDCLTSDLGEVSQKSRKELTIQYPHGEPSVERGEIPSGAWESSCHPARTPAPSPLQGLMWKHLKPSFKQITARLLEYYR